MLATQTEVSDGTLNIINVGIEFFSQADISVSLDQSETPLVLGVDYQWSAATTIQFLNTVNTPGGLVPNGVEVVIRRSTPNSEMFNIYDGGAPFSRLTLDENFKQLLLLSQEFSEGLGLDGLRNHLDMNGYKVIDLGDPVDPDDATNKGYVDARDNALYGTTLRTPENIPMLPDAAGRANKLLGFDLSGNPLIVAPTSGSATDLALALADGVTPGNGASMIGYNGSTVQAELDASMRILDLANTSNMLKGVALVGGAGRVVNTIADLKALPTAGSKSAFVLGYYAAGDGGGGLYRYDSTDLASVDNGGTLIVATDLGRWKLVNTNCVNSRTFGAKGDAVTDDTVRLQAYVDWCASFTLWKPMVISGKCLTSASLTVARQVDTTLSEWRVIAENSESGFLQNTAFTLFESTVAMPGVDPVSEAITFENIRFEGGAAAGGAYILTRKFLRIKFLNCYFYKIRLMTTDTYIQSFYFSNCNIRFWPGIWIVASHAFDTHFVQCQSEFGAGFLTNFANGSYNLTFTDGLHEGSGGGLVSGGGFRQMKIDGYYLEQNASVDVDLSAGATNWEVTITNTIFASTPANVANASYWNIVWGPTVNARAGGNYHTNGRLHDNTGLAAGGLLWGAEQDAATLSTIRNPLLADGGTGSFTLTTTLGSGTSTYARYLRRNNMLRIEYSFIFSGTSGSNATFTNLPLPAANPVLAGTVDYSDYAATAIRIVGGATFGSASQFRPASDQAGAGITYTALNGKTIVGAFEYRVA